MTRFLVGLTALIYIVPSAAARNIAITAGGDCIDKRPAAATPWQRRTGKVMRGIQVLIVLISMATLPESAARVRLVGKTGDAARSQMQQTFAEFCGCAARKFKPARACAEQRLSDGLNSRMKSNYVLWLLTARLEVEIPRSCGGDEERLLTAFGEEKMDHLCFDIHEKAGKRSGYLFFSEDHRRIERIVY